MKFDKEFKLALTHLPEKEKDKLIIRLLKKDLTLARRLYFELVETDTIEEKRENLAEAISKRIKLMTQHFYSPGYLMMDMREISGVITEHIKTTKDKYGEVSLNLLMLNEVLSQNLTNINNATNTKRYKFGIYVLSRTFKILILINSFHEDLKIEFEDELFTLSKVIGKSEFLMKLAIQNGLDLNWINTNNIPENIAKIHKDIRERGFLR